MLTIVIVHAYSTDTDPAINSFAAQNWTSHLGLKEVESWRPWTVDGCRRMGGYVTRYEGDFDFLTIRGAGHMVRLIQLMLLSEFVTQAVTYTATSNFLNRSRQTKLKRHSLL